MKTVKRKVEKPVEDTKWYLKIDYQSYTDVTRHRDPDEKWDADDLAHSQSINGYSTHTNLKGGWDFVLSKKPSAKQPFYLVYVNYSTGDSFHHETGCIEFVDVFESEKDGDALVDMLDKDYAKFKKADRHDYTPLKVKLPSGVEREIYTSTWKGYFERLEGVQCVRIDPI
jgi:hypothetical protein